MNNKPHTILSCFVVILIIGYLSACSSPSIKTNPIKIKRLILLNKSTSPLKNVRIYITKTKEMVSCGYILPKTECSTGFPLREYQGNRFDVSWLDNDQPRSVKNIQVAIPETLIADRAVNAVIIFGEQGRFSARLQH